jgi:hypothetical protein
MKYPRYNYVAEEKMQVFEFTSIGTKGEIKKIVEFTLLNVNNVYNLGFGDYDPKTDKINDSVITNNGDSQKVLATVV